MFPREEKKHLRWKTPERENKKQNKQKKVQEAGNLRAFYKLDIIDN